MPSAATALYQLVRRAQAAPVRRVVITLVVLTCLLTGAGIIRVAHEHEILQLGYRLSRTTTLVRQLREAQQRLELERAMLTAPDRIRRLATALGMTQVEPHKIRVAREAAP